VHSRQDSDIEGGAPPFPLLLLEGQRAFFEGLATRATASLLLRHAPRGQGQPVLVLPGFMAGDRSTRFLRRTLRRLGFDAHPWLLGQNRGMTPKFRIRLTDRVEAMIDRHGDDLSIVGWSLGGIYAREIAKMLPEQVRQVVTLGSPFANATRASRGSRLYGFLTGREGREGRDEMAAELRTPPPVPSTSIFTRTDGIVHWRACLEPESDHTENIEVPGSHCGLGVNSLALLAVADRLSQPKGSWQPFTRDRWRRYAYG
jgi:pimeloyl-ACP methyl ester carboxylesterase